MKEEKMEFQKRCIVPGALSQGARRCVCCKRKHCGLASASRTRAASTGARRGVAGGRDRCGDGPLKACPATMLQGRALQTPHPCIHIPPLLIAKYRYRNLQSFLKRWEKERTSRNGPQGPPALPLEWKSEIDPTYFKLQWWYIRRGDITETFNSNFL